jgi:hypothetical protein
MAMRGLNLIAVLKAFFRRLKPRPISAVGELPKPMPEGPLAQQSPQTGSTPAQDTSPSQEAREEPRIPGSESNQSQEASSTEAEIEAELAEIGKEVKEEVRPAIKEEPSEIVLFEEFRAERFLLTMPFFFIGGIEKIEIGNPRGPFYWKVSAHQDYGKPEELALSLHRKVEEIIQGMPRPLSNPLPLGSLYRISAMLGLSWGGRTAKKLKAAFESIKATVIKAKIGKCELITGPYESVYFKGERMPNGEVADQVYLFLADWYLDNLNRNQVRHLDTKFYSELSLYEKRLYELIGAKFYGIFEVEMVDGEKKLKQLRPFINYRYSTLCQLLPTKRQKYLSRHKALLEAHKGLTDKGFFLRVEEERLKKDNFGEEWLFRYYPGERAKAEILKYLEPKRPPQPEAAPLLEGKRVYNSPLSPQEIEQRAFEIAEKLGDIRLSAEGKRVMTNPGFYIHLVRHCPEEIINTALIDTEMEWRDGKIHTSKAQFFTWWVQELAASRHYDLQLKVEAPKPDTETA